MRLRQGGLKKPEFPDARCAAGLLEESSMKVDYLTQREVAHQASRRYSSAFLRSTRSAA